MIPAAPNGTLLRRTCLHPRESISSLLARLALLNGYTPSNVLLDPLQRPVELRGIATERLGCPQSIMLMHRLAHLTNITVSDLVAATGHRFASTLMPPQMVSQDFVISDGDGVGRLDRRIAGSQLLGERVVQYCSQCLTEAPYHRLIWMPYATAACLQHRCLLRTTCPACDARLRIDDLVRTHCRRCQTDLTQIPSVSLSEDAKGLLTQHILQTWLSDGNMPNELAHRLPAAPVNALYRVMDGLRIVTLQHASEWSYLHPLPDGTVWPPQRHGTHLRALTPAQRYAVYTTAVQGLLEWPTGFTQFLDAYQARNDGCGGGGMHVDLRTVYARWLERAWRHPAFQFVQDAFEQHVIDIPRFARTAAYARRCRTTPSLAQRFSYITVREAARVLDTTPDKVRRLIATRTLSAISAPYNRRFVLLHRAEVVALRQGWSELVTLTEAAALLGLSEAIVTDLYVCGVLEAEQIPAEGFQRWMFTQEILTAWRNRVIQAVELSARSVCSPNDVLSLVTVTRMLTAFGETAATILRAVAEGRFPAALPNPQSPLQDLQFTRADACAYRACLKQERGWMSRAEVRQLLKVKDTTLAMWVRVGRLTPVLVRGTVQWFARGDVYHFTRACIGSVEAASLLGVRPLTVQTWVRQGRLPAVSGPGIDSGHVYLFDRDQLLAWRAGRLTAGETTALLGVSRATLHRWIEAGRVQPLTDMGGTQRWFARSEIMLLIDRGLAQPEHQAMSNRT